MEADESRGLLLDARPARSRLGSCFAVLTGVVVLCARASTSPSGEESAKAASTLAASSSAAPAGVVLERWTHTCALEVATGCTLALTLRDTAEAGVELAVAHRPLSDSTGSRKVWHSASVAAGLPTASLSLSLCRIKANTAYAVEVWARRRGDASSPALLATETFVSAATGRGFVDDERFGIPLGPKRSKWELLSLAHATAHNDGRDEWSGLVVVDTDGDVVWHVGLDLGKGFVSWDRVHAGENGNASWAVLRLRNSYGDMCSLAQPSNCSALLTLDQVGRVTTTYEQRCEGDVLGYNSLHHECLHVGGTKVLSLAASAQYLPGLPIDYDQYHHEVDPGYFVGDALVEWDFASNELSTLFDFMDNGVNPREVSLVSNISSEFSTLSIACAGGAEPTNNGGAGGAQQYEAIEWSHASSAAPARNGSGGFLVTLRNLNAVVALAANQSGGALTMDWVLSPSIASDFTFERANASAAELAMRAEVKAARHGFFRPHSVRQLDSGNILLMDDGGTRANCTCNSDDCDAAASRCFSRAVSCRAARAARQNSLGCLVTVSPPRSPQVEYSLDRDTKTATLVWSFSYPGAAGALAQLEREDMFLVDGGSVYREDELYLVGFTVAKTDAATLGNHTRVFEVDNAGEARSQMAFPSGASTWNSGAWRFLPVADLCGESTECPFDDGEDACS